MARESLLDYFQPNSRPSDEPSLVWREGYRQRRWTYGKLLASASRFASELAVREINKGDRVLIWGQNSGPWVAAFLGCILRGAVAVPLDVVGDASFSRRVAQQAGVRLAVVGRELPSEALAPQTICLDELEAVIATRRNEAPPDTATARRHDALEIVFTSGTTAEPRGVVLTHGNVLSNLAPIEAEFARYRRYERFVHPLRFLNLLPLSHVFGQFMGIFLPQIFGATVVFMDTLNPAEVVREIRRERVSVLIAVPRLIESLKGQVERELESRGKIAAFRRNFDKAANEHFLRRWWRFRAIRRQFGWKFWAMVSGGAALPAAAEIFWTRLGYAVIQGYGLTETTSLISVNHPFRLGRGSIGKPLPGLEVELSDEGEILVRGENIATGYWKQSGVAPATDAEGWFHTGDLGERDEAGNLYFKGRSKNVIVTPEGLKVFPGDLEAELRKEPDLRDCVVVGLNRNGNAEPCAVLLLRDPASPDAHDRASEIVRHANTRLASFQHIRQWVVWRDNDFPRTPTQKPVLSQISQVAEAQLHGGAAPASSVNDLLARVSGGRGVARAMNEPLQLSSVERVELMGALEDRYQVDLSEADFSSADTAASIERLLTNPPPRAPAFRYPRWPLSWPARAFRTVAFAGLARPAMALLGWPAIRGRENAAGARAPLVIVSNHITFFDPAYVMIALPRSMRRRLAIAMDGELLESMRTPPPAVGFFRSLIDRATYFLLVSIFNVFPLPRHAGFQRSFAFMGELIDRGWNVLIFPEGERTRSGETNPFRAGIGLLAARLSVPILPVYLGGIWELKERGKHWAKPGQIKVAVGTPVKYAPDADPEEITRNLHHHVSDLASVSKKD